MGRGLAFLVVVLGACNAQLHLGDQNKGPSPDGPVASDAPADGPNAPDAPAMLGPWGTPQLIPGASNQNVNEDDGTPNQALTELYLSVDNGATNKDLFWMTRAAPTDPWGPKQLLAQSNGNDESPRLSYDELTLYYGRNGDIYAMTRATTTSPWGPPSIVAAVNVTGNNVYEKWLATCDNNYYMEVRDSDLWEGTLGNAPTKVTSLSTTGSEISTWLSKDCKTVMFARTPLNGQEDIYMSTRNSVTDPWPAATAITDFNTPTSNEEDAWMSLDQKTFVFASNAGGTKDIYISTR
jgi:hypothetical protein